nr:gag-asp_proteas domain-containing protein [Ipomoea batatas]
MRVKLKINATPITALIDSGSTHNFVDASTANRLGLPVRECPYLNLRRYRPNATVTTALLYSRVRTRWPSGHIVTRRLKRMKLSGNAIQC